MTPPRKNEISDAADARKVENSPIDSPKTTKKSADSTKARKKTVKKLAKASTEPIKIVEKSLKSAKSVSARKKTPPKSIKTPSVGERVALFFAAFVHSWERRAKSALLVYCPPLWRKLFGRRRHFGERFEDFSENVEKATPNPKDVLGRVGERLAFEYFRRDSRCDILACNVSAFFCELDLVFIDRKTQEFVVVEVKTRRRENALYPTLGAVDARRRKKMALAGRRYANELGETRRRLRFDVVTIIWPLGEEPTLTHHKNVFSCASAIRGYRENNFGLKKRGD